MKKIEFLFYTMLFLNICFIHTVTLTFIIKLFKNIVWSGISILLLLRIVKYLIYIDNKCVNKTLFYLFGIFSTKISLIKMFKNKKYFTVNINIYESLAQKAKYPTLYEGRMFCGTPINKKLNCWIDSEYLYMNIVGDHTMSYYDFSTFKIQSDIVIDKIIENFYICENKKNLNKIIEEMFNKHLFMDNQRIKFEKFFKDGRNPTKQKIWQIIRGMK